jgi:phospholipid/cholesterol/gamma-HCH transport system substrate-binding protein
MFLAFAKAVAAPLAGVIVGGAALANVVTGDLLTGSGSGYQVTVVFPDAANLVRGGQVQVDGLAAGSIKSLEVRDGKALVKISLNDAHAPLHSGTDARIDYRALLGERIVTLKPGPGANPAIPDGGIIEGGAARIDFDQFLRTFDEPTREHLRKALPALDSVLAGREEQVGETLEVTAPFTEAVAQLLAAVGQDGPALRQLVTSLRDLSTRLVDRQSDITGVIDGLERFMTAGARQDEALVAGLDALPATLQSASGALAKVPAAAQATVPLLADLRPVVEQLGPVSALLGPTLAELRPTLAAFRPALVSLAGLLDVSPALLATAGGFLPSANQALGVFNPALDFLRPYAPEIAGAVSNFASAAANYDRNGHYVRVLSQGSMASFGRHPSGSTPSQKVKPHRVPGENEDKPWTGANADAVDANGDPLR